MPVITGIRRSRVLTAVAAGAIAWSMTIAAGAEPPAQTLVKESTARLVEVLKSERESLRDDPRRLREVVEELILPYFDFERMSRRVLGKKQWKKAGPAQRARFVSAFRSLLVHTYATVLNQYSDQTITWLDPVPRKRDDEIVIPVLIGPAGNRLSASRTRCTGTGRTGKAFDVSIDGVSLVTNYRSSFRAEIARHGIDGLITRIETKN